MESFMRPAQVRQNRGYSEASLYREVAARLLTRPVKISSRAVGWPKSEIEALNAARIAGKTEDEIRELVHELEAARTSSR
jgi:prophage regulatory protein